MFIRVGEAHPRSLAKAVSWRLLGSCDTFVLGLLVTHNLAFAGSIASIETVTKIVLYYFHERLWATVPWGRAKAVPLGPSQAKSSEPVELAAAA